MNKFKYLLAFFSFIVLNFLIFNIHVCYENNDDQLLQFISSGTLTSNPSSYLVLTNVLIGKALSFLYSTFSYNGINWYFLYLCFCLQIAYLTIVFVFYKEKMVSSFAFFASLVIFLFGVFLPFFIQIQFTAVALFLCFAALLLLQTELTTKAEVCIVLFLISVAILIRKESFFIFILFSVPLLLFLWKNNISLKKPIFVIIFSSVFFFLSDLINKQQPAYITNNTYAEVNAFDRIYTKPISFTSTDLTKNNLTESDIRLIQNWYAADSIALEKKQVIAFSEQVKSHRNVAEVQMLVKKLIADERYLVLLVLVSFLSLFLVGTTNKKLAALNIVLTFALFLYLMIFSRLPRRVTSPVLVYLFLQNLLLIMKCEQRLHLKNLILFVLVLLSFYKAYCVVKLNSILREKEVLFTNAIDEINKHPNTLFIATANDLNLQYISAFQNPKHLLKHKNLVLIGWYLNTPTFIEQMQQLHLTNLTTDLLNRNDVVFISSDVYLENAIIDVLNKRYSKRAQFLPVEGFLHVSAKKLTAFH